MRWSPYQDVDMIDSDIAFHYIHLMLQAYLLDDLPQPKTNLVFQNPVTIFGLPHEVVLKIGNCMCSTSVALPLHSLALQIFL